MPSAHPAAKSIDGVVGRPAQKATQPHKPVSAKPAPSKPVAASNDVIKAKPAVKRTAAVHAKARTVKPSATLMRHVVAKPVSAPLKRHTKVQTSLQGHGHVSLSGNAVVVPKLSLYSINPHRAARANQVAMSPRVSRFTHQVMITVTQDAEQAVQTIDKAIVIPETPTVMYQPDVRRASTPSSSDIFEQALLRATGHEQPVPDIKTKKGRRAARSLRRRMVSFTAGAVVVLALVGAFGYHQSDTNRFRAAANQAGFAATMPGYQPDGFALADIKVSGGYLNVRYQNATSTYAVAEKPTSWDESMLINQITSSPATKTYAKVEKAGRTVYIYGRNQAAWVQDGILYQVLGNGALGTNDIVEIAASM